MRTRKGGGRLSLTGLYVRVSVAGDAGDCIMCFASAD